MDVQVQNKFIARVETTNYFSYLRLYHLSRKTSIHLPSGNSSREKTFECNQKKSFLGKIFENLLQNSLLARLLFNFSFF